MNALPNVMLNRSLLRRPDLAWLLAALLLTAQALGLAHHVRHAPGLAAGAAVWVDGHAADSADCRLVDQLTHADALCGATFAPPSPPQVAVQAAAVQVAAAAAAAPAAYQARAPPHGA